MYEQTEISAEHPSLGFFPKYIVFQGSTEINSNYCDQGNSGLKS